VKASAEIRDEVLEELYAYYLGPGEFYGSDELLDRLCEAVIALAELEERGLATAGSKHSAGRRKGGSKDSAAATERGPY